MKSVSSLLAQITVALAMVSICQSAVIRTKQNRASTKYKDVVSSRAKLADKLHPSRYLKEEAMLPGLTAKQKLFLPDLKYKTPKHPGK